MVEMRIEGEGRRQRTEKSRERKFPGKLNLVS